MTCLQGASALENLLRADRDPKLRVFVVWEPVIATDLRAPSTRVLARVSDRRVRQYWDRGRLLSQMMGEKDKASIVWDVINVYGPDVRWNERLPASTFSDRPVVRVIERAATTLAQVRRAAY